ncbi:MAG: hypothetical protein HYT39_01955 [Candidatus Sungbacteria bacterium]|nr:hypothetical protein [Candidatus Sungbacteria bacterium]
MSGKRLTILLILIAIFAGGVFALKTIIKVGQEPAGSNSSDSQVIRGFVETLLPSGKVIVVKKDDGTEVLLSLSDASTITDELGEDLFYTDVKVGMPISASGIRDVKDNVVIPSLITVQLSYANRGFMQVLSESLQPVYYSLRYNEALWKPSTTTVSLAYNLVPGCVLEPSGTPPAIPGDWVKSVTERRISSSIFQDARYTLKGEHQLRVITLEDPGGKYGASGEDVLRSPQDFVVKYPKSISGPALADCSRAVDEILSSFLLRQASQNSLLIEPKSPISVFAGEDFTLRGVARAFDGNIYLTIVNGAGGKVLSRAISVKTAEGARFGRFQTELRIPKTAESRLQLRLFQYSPSSGAVIDLIQLPLTAK